MVILFGLDLLAESAINWYSRFCYRQSSLIYNLKNLQVWFTRFTNNITEIYLKFKSTLT